MAIVADVPSRMFGDADALVDAEQAIAKHLAEAARPGRLLAAGAAVVIAPVLDVAPLGTLGHCYTPMPVFRAESPQAA
jgi:hypothetical protein